VQNRTGLGNGGGGEEKKKEERRQCAVLVSSPTTQETNHLFALLCFAFLSLQAKPTNQPSQSPPVPTQVGGTKNLIN
jgi:hypothetical protein